MGYCQGMNYLAAMLLCILQHRQEDAFWVLAALIDDGGALSAGKGQSAPCSSLCLDKAHCKASTPGDKACALLSVSFAWQRCA